MQRSVGSSLVESETREAPPGRRRPGMHVSHAGRAGNVVIVVPHTPATSLVLRRKLKKSICARNFIREVLIPTAVLTEVPSLVLR